MGLNRDIEEKGYPTREAFDDLYKDGGRYYLEIDRGMDIKIYWDFYYNLWKDIDWKKQLLYREKFEEIYPKMIGIECEYFKNQVKELCHNEERKKLYYWWTFEYSWHKFEHIENPDEREKTYLKEFSIGSDDFWKVC